MGKGGLTTSAPGTPTGIVVACLILLSVSSVAQQGDSGRFEAASVKINRTEVPLRLMIGPANRVYATRVDLRQVIWTAYGVDRLQVVGGPNWIDTPDSTSTPSPRWALRSAPRS